MDFEDEENENERKKEPKIPISVYISQGERFKQLLQFRKALACFDAALASEPTNERCLLGRAKCLISVANFAAAKQEAEKALDSNPASPQATALKAEAEYLIGDFEHAFITYQRAHKSRPNYGAFRLGQQECERAINNALCPDDQWFDEDEVREVSAVLDPLQRTEDPPHPQKKTSSSRQRTGLMYAKDVKFLEKLLEDRDLSSVHPECKSLLSYLKDLEGFWRNQDPDTRRVFTSRYSSGYGAGK